MGVAAVGVLLAGLFGAVPDHLPGLPGLAPPPPHGVAVSAAATGGPQPRRTSGAPGSSPTPTVSAGQPLIGSPTPSAGSKGKGRPSDAPSHPVRPSKNR